MQSTSRRALAQYHAADNMTDRMAALAILSLHDVPARTEALQDFYQRYESDPLIIDKWIGPPGDDPGRPARSSACARSRPIPPSR